VIVGNVVEDLLPNGSRCPGGPSLYSAWVASALGVDVTLYSRVTADYDQSAFGGFNVVNLPAATCPLFSNCYDDAGRRTQYLYETGETIAASDLPSLEGDALLVAPAFHELSTVPANDIPASVVMLQAALRTVDDYNRVSPTSTPLEAVENLLFPNGTVIFSEEDASRPLELAQSLMGRCGAVILTLGSKGVMVFRAGVPTETVPGYPAESKDPTGAGDAFAAAFTIRLSETGDLLEACRFANAAGSLAVEGSGREAIPTRPHVEERMLQGAA
jgi:sugar/nucleoside kinase (ribokinase family)